MSITILKVIYSTDINGNKTVSVWDHFTNTPCDDLQNFPVSQWSTCGKDIADEMGIEYIGPCTHYINEDTQLLCFDVA